MSYVKEYFVIILAVGAVMGVLQHVTHERSRTSVGFILGLVVLVSVISPLPSLFEKISSEDIGAGQLPNIDAGDSAYYETAEDALREGLTLAICNEYGVDKECVYVRLQGFDFETMSAESVYITLSGDGCVLDFHEVEEYIEKNFCGRCRVEIKFG